MKSYKNVELFAKNAPFGSYAAGCPTGRKQNGNLYDDSGRQVGSTPYGCSACEIAG